MPFRRQNFISGRGIFHGTTELFVPRQEFQGESLAPVVHLYGSEEDTLATIEASGYFDELALTDPRPAGFQYPIVRVGDLIHVLATNGSAELTLTQISPVFTTQVTQPELVPGSVQTEDLVDLAVSTAKLADGSVTTPKIADNAVISSKLADNSVTTAKIVDLAVTGAKMANSTITSTQLADNAVTTAKITDANVTNAKMAADSVDTAQIVDLSVTLGKLAAGSVDESKVTFITSGTHNTTWEGAYVTPQTNNVLWRKNGNAVTLYFPFLSVSATATTTLNMSTVLPAELRPIRSFNYLQPVIHNGRRTGGASINFTGGVTFYGTDGAGNFDSGQTAGFDNSTFTYFLD